MHVVEIDTRNRNQVRKFLRFPFDLYRSTPQWVPPLASDVARMLDRSRHPFYQHSDAAFFLAEEDARVVGRIAVLDNRHYNEYNHEKTAFFYLFECEERQVTAQALFDAAFGWARGRGLDRIQGPKGFTALDGMGLLVDGFDHRPALGIPYNLPYYATFLEAAGFAGSGDVVSGYLSAKAAFPDRIHRLSEVVQKRRGLTIARFRSRRDLRALVPKLGTLYNASLTGTTGNVPLTEDEIQTIANQMLMFADPRLIKIVMKDDDPIGYLFAYPDISAAVQRTAGRIYPLGWIDLLWELRRTKWININGAAIVEQYRGLGGTAILFSEMYKSVIEGGFEHADVVQIGVSNENMQREMRDLGIDFYKTHRNYTRVID